jgi:hypothetical protein
MPGLSRRSLLVALFLAANFAADIALASDEDSGSGSGNSGSGSNSSGSGSGDDRDDDDGDDDNEDGDNSGNQSSGGRDDDQERAIKAVRRGKAVSLKKLREHLSQNYSGKILDVKLRRRSGDYFYNVRMLAKGNRLRMLSLNALTLRPQAN